MRRIVAVVAAACFAAGLIAPAHAADAMNEGQARAAAVKILKGDPFGRTDAQIL